MAQIFELQAINDTRKSFYGKALILIDGGVWTLRSYSTNVCYLDEKGEFHRTWGGWSATTARHINEFRQQNGLSKLSKDEWFSIPCEC